MDHLNPEQTAAVLAPDSRLLVVAGAGTGKTATLAHRAARLLERDVPPSSVLALTFTRRAAAEMAQRIAELTGLEAAGGMWLGTIHATCYRMLAHHGHLVGYPTLPTVYSEDDAKSLMEGVLERMNLAKRHSVKQMAAALKNGAASPDLRRACEEYRRMLHVSGAVDYDGLIAAALAILEDPEALAHYRGRFAHVLVDEAQDLFPSCWRLLDRLNPDNLFLVGDDGQMIYGFLQASIERFLKCADGGWSVHKLTHCYRCTRPILALGNAILARNMRQLRKTLVTDKEGDPVQARGFDTDEAEAKWIGAEITALHAAGRPWNEIAVLCRTNAFVERLADRLTEAEVPVQAVGAVDPFATAAGRLVVDMLRVSANPADEMALRRILLAAGTDARGLAKVEIGRLKDGTSLLAAARRLDGTPCAAQCVGLLDGLAALADDAPGAVRYVLEGFRRLPPLAHLAAGVNVLPMLRTVDEWAHGGLSVAGLLLLQATKAAVDLWEPAEDAVSVMTIHSAKGLEFPVVFVPGWEEGSLPHRAAMGSPVEIEEERRVAHVAVTRAAERLYTTWCAERQEWHRIWRRNRSHLLDSLPGLPESPKCPQPVDNVGDHMGTEKIIAEA